MALWTKKGKAEETPPPPKTSNGAREAAAKPAAAPKPTTGKEAPRQPSGADPQQGEAASTRLLFRLGEIVSVMMRARAIPCRAARRDPGSGAAAPDVGPIPGG